MYKYITAEQFNQANWENLQSKPFEDSWSRYLMKELFNKYYGEYYSLFTKEEALDKGIFGDTKDVDNSLEFLGDFIAIANGEISLEYPNEKSKKKRFKFRAHHSGGTEDESLISVIAINF